MLCQIYPFKTRFLCNREQEVLDLIGRESGFSLFSRPTEVCSLSFPDRLCASALERVSAHPALVAALAEVLRIREAEAENAVRQQLEGIGGLHDFMRLAGVVRDRVRCEQDGGTQLDALDGRCWLHVRRYLRLDDVTFAPSCP
ncbi:hypothetical protein HPB51_021638 [Rhipicephalus microplus]|uniref:Uncharacterized protein n=1 Tax=Rhipicephalus microplus TaxID=6941 RepID=A0A9J6EUV0_RHIMP|nr:hypothetical protein HPB51_021633 [Rhipicephalus microplus]KAH8038081.1 hypothetical protein HPB51_021638 [Rhipicephalus microplus]